MIFILLACVPMAQRISGRYHQLPSYVSHSQGYVIGSAYEPELLSIRLHERVPTTSSLENGDSHLIVAVKMNQLVSEVLGLHLDGSYSILCPSR